MSLDPLPRTAELMNRVFEDAQKRLNRSRGRLQRELGGGALNQQVGISVARWLEDRCSEVFERDEEYDLWFKDSVLAPYRTALEFLEMGRQVGTYANRRALQVWCTNCGEPRFLALVQLHAYSILLTSEISLLLAHGYPEGAEARWRALHEVEVIAQVIGPRRQSLAQRYLDHIAVELHRDLENGTLGNSADRARLGASSLASEINERHLAAIGRYGKGFKTPYGWAQPIRRKGHVTFRDLEQKARRSPRRPRYIHASRYVHGTVWASSVALRRGEEGVQHVGPRFSGLAYPLLQTIWTASEITGVLLSEAAKVSGSSEPLVWDEVHVELSANADLYARRAGADFAMRQGNAPEAEDLRPSPRLMLMRMARGSW